MNARRTPGAPEAGPETHAVAAGASSVRLDPLLIDAGAPRYDRETLVLHLERYELASRHVSGLDVVDCACGTGYGSEMLANSGARTVQAVDVDGPALAFARERHAHDAVRYIQADATRWRASPVPHVWVAFETIEHLPSPTEYVRSIAEQLEPGGILLASVPVTVSTDGNPHHLHDFTRREFRRLLTRHGFVVEHELLQQHRFSLVDVFGQGRGDRQRNRRRGILGWYVRHPRVFVRRVWLTLTRGLMNEYLTIVARRLPGLPS